MEGFKVTSRSEDNPLAWWGGRQRWTLRKRLSYVLNVARYRAARLLNSIRTNRFWHRQLAADILYLVAWMITETCPNYDRHDGRKRLSGFVVRRLWALCDVIEAPIWAIYWAEEDAAVDAFEASLGTARH